jgi:hypothetical protein
VVLERNVKKPKGTTGAIDVFWPGQILACELSLSPVRGIGRFFEKI